MPGVMLGVSIVLFCGFKNVDSYRNLKRQRAEFSLMGHFQVQFLQCLSKIRKMIILRSYVVFHSDLS
jgi:hypothetical protein